MNRNCRCISRSGFTIVELLVTISVSAVLLAVVTITLQGTLRADQNVRHQLESHRTLSRLSVQFRQDVHASNRLSSPLAEQLVLTITSDRQITYQIEPQQITRIVESKSQNQRDVFILPNRAVAHFAGENLLDTKPGNGGTADVQSARIVIQQHDWTGTQTNQVTLLANTIPTSSNNTPAQPQSSTTTAEPAP